jgi:hypothetical protein
LIPTDPKAFLSSSEFAITQLFEALKKFDETINPLDKERYESARLSRAIIAGSIITVGHQFIQKFGDANDIREELREGFKIYDVKIAEALRRACSGRNVYGFPLGLLVYLGRHQHQHSHENEPLRKTNSVVRDLFNKSLNEWLHKAHALAKSGEKSMLKQYRVGVDPLAFDDNGEISSFMFSSNILHTIGWCDFDGFASDLMACLG